MSYRKLTQNEIDSLQKQGCFCENWDNISVKDGFFTNRIRNVSFSGTIRLGVYNEDIENEYGINKPTGLYDSNIHNCELADNVLISNVKNLANYKIEDNVAIENVFHLAVFGETTFGNGTEIEILNEGGGRELLIFDKLSSQIAYLLVIYRHNVNFINKLQKIIRNYVQSKRATKGLVQENSRIINCQKIINVFVGAKTSISGALLLQDGTIASNKTDPVSVGEGVIATSFIFQSGSKVKDSSHLQNCFVGQAVQIGKQYSAENSAFFSNSEGFHGEACSVFAGPYTVTHHKSTLLIAGLFSFYNAGSGSNQSNHMYKIGPVHQGILERGAKTGSFSYLLWPSRIGAFSVVIGKHYSNFDTSLLPFSYILESNGKSLLMPAMNLFTVGTRRDSEKWQKRDRRKDSEKHDLLNFELFNRYTIGKIKRGIGLLKHLGNRKNENGFIEYNGIIIKQSKIKEAIEKYSVAINIFIGKNIFNQLENISENTTFSELQNKLSPKNDLRNDEWVDLSGMFAPKSTIEKLEHSIESEAVTKVEPVIKELISIHEKYSSFSWSWCVRLIEEHLNKVIKEITPEDLVQLIINWKKSTLTYNEKILQDAEKEFSSKNRIGYGLDGDEEIKVKDFESVRGSLKENKFVVQIKEESKLVTEKAENLIHLLSVISQN